MCKHTWRRWFDKAGEERGEEEGTAKSKDNIADDRGRKLKGLMGGKTGERSRGSKRKKRDPEDEEERN